MKILIGLVVLVLLLVAAILSLPFLIDLNKYQDQYKPLIEEALNRKIILNDIRLTIWPRIGVRVAGFTVQDDPAFGTGPFASLTSLDVGVKLMPLLSKKVEVEEITLRDPLITVIKNRKGEMNLSTIGPKTPARSSPEQPEAPPSPTGNPLHVLALLAVDHVSFTGGTIIYRDESTPKPTEYRVNDLEVLLKSVHLGETPTLHLAATVQPYNIPVKLDGSFGPLVDTFDLKQFAFDIGLGKIAMALKGSVADGNLDATLTSPLINSVDVPVALPLAKPVIVRNFHVTAKAKSPLPQGVPPLELADVTDLGLDIVLGNSVLNVKGTVAGGHAKINITSPVINTADVPMALPFKKPVDIKDLQMAAELKGQEARVNNLSFQLFGGHTKAQAGMTLDPSAPPFNGKVVVQGLQLGPALDALGSDQVSISGTAGMNFAMVGRGFSLPDLTKALEGVGHVAVKDGKIEGVNLIQEALSLLQLVGLSPDNVKVTAFSTIETDLRIKEGIINVQRLLMDSHDFQATGEGTVGFDQTLNLKVKLNLSQALSQKISGSSQAARLALAGGRLNVPLLVTGTVQAPSYGLDSKALTGKVQEQVKEKVKEALGDLLKGSTKPDDLKQKGQDLLKGLLGQ
ncbi:MAG: AsmA family protein [Nitrospirota bacterium]|nr:AsmA family protein [Nitrospirota bacterium]